MNYSAKDAQALRAMVDVAPAHLSMPVGEIISVSEAMKIAGVSDETIRRWCSKYGIGRKYRAHTWSDNVWQVSRPGLLIVMAKDWDALEALMSGDRSAAVLQPYLEC
jgi:hypothetical protein